MSQSSLGRKLAVPLWRIVKAIIYRLKTGCQWRELPIRQFFTKKRITWKSIFDHYNKWSKDGSWQRLWTYLLKHHKAQLDMSSVQLDGSHTPAKRGGEQVDYQKRKACKTTNLLFVTDRQGIPLAVSNPIAGNHHDLFDIEKQLTKMMDDFNAAQINPNGLFLNADAGFDSLNFRQFCDSFFIQGNVDLNKRNSKNPDLDFLLDELLYKERFSVERTNAWLDGFKAILTRFEVKARNWLSLHYLAFSIILLRKIQPQYF